MDWLFKERDVTKYWGEVDRMTLWMVRAGEEAFLIDDFRNKNLIAIGWNYLDDLNRFKNKEEVKSELKKKEPSYDKYKIGQAASKIWSFVHEFKINDDVMTYDPDKREYLIGKITTDYQPNSKECVYHNVRGVNWQRTIDRDKLSATTKFKLGAINTLFKVHEDASEEIFSIIQGKKKEPETPEEEEAEIYTIKEDNLANAHEFIKDKLMTLNWEEMQELVAGLLRGMGYKTIVSPKGPDRGKDILASPDGLGLTLPRIKVEVKHQSDVQMGSSDIRSFIGGLRGGDSGLFVSTGGFTKDARYEGDRANHPLTLIDSDMLVDLIIEYYDNFDADTKALIPLTKVYWPS
jgi:restriction system protein